MPPIVTVTASIDCFPLRTMLGPPIAAVPVAVDVPPVAPALKVTLGAVVYPEPGLVMVTEATACADDSAAVAVAPLPPPPVNPTVGAVEYPVPAAVTVTEATKFVVVTLPVALVPPAAGALKVTLIAPDVSE